MSPAEAFDLTSELEKPLYLLVIQDAETIYNRQISAGGPDHFVGIEFEVRLVPDGEHHGVSALPVSSSSHLDA